MSATTPSSTTQSSSVPSPAGVDPIARQQPSRMPYHRYRPYHSVFQDDLPDRTWPNRRIEKAARCCAIYLRDSIQAVIDTMSSERKRRMFMLLVSLRHK